MQQQIAYSYYGKKLKINKDYFKKLTGYKGNTSEHGRDAAMLVFWHNGLNIN